jgi:hypothetical protein
LVAHVISDVDDRVQSRDIKFARSRGTFEVEVNAMELLEARIPDQGCMTRHNSTHVYFVPCAPCGTPVLRRAMLCPIAFLTSLS